MLSRLLKNKKIMVVVTAIFLVLCVSILVLVTSNTKETGDKDEDIKTEQSRGDVESQSNNDGTDIGNKVDSNGDESSKLEVLQPDEFSLEDSSDASGSWGDTPQSNPQMGNTDGKTDKTENEKPNEEDEKDDSEESDEVAPEGSSEATGSLENSPESNSQTGNIGDKTDKTENEESNGEDKKNEDILKDNINWGNIY